MTGALEARARRLLARPGAWLDQTGDGYAVRVGDDRRRRPALRLDEAVFMALARQPGLTVRRGGGWSLRIGAAVTEAAAPGRPGIIDGERSVVEPDGRMARRAVNLGESPIAWLARRRDAAGQPWLTPAEAAAGERLREDAEAASLGPSVTMRWDGAPRRGSGNPAQWEPGARSLKARERVRAALDAAGPGLSELLERVCIHGSALEAAERGLGLPRRAGKTVLKLALQRLAIHYRIG